MNVDEELLVLYALAFAPLSNDTVLTEVEYFTTEDVNFGVLIKESEFVDGFQRVGIKAFTDYLNAHEGEASAEVHTALACYGDYLKRLKSLYDALRRVNEMLNESQPSATGLLQQLQTDTQKDRRPTKTAEIERYLDMTRHTPWGSPTLAPESSPKKVVGFGGVEFREINQLISHGTIDEASPKLKAGSRCSTRKPTGYNKFTFRASDLRLADDTGTSSDAQTQQYPLSTSASSHAGVESRDSSVFGSISEDCAQQERQNPFADSTRSRTSSSVAFPCASERLEIDDRDADPEWNEDAKRIERRFHRIRARKPTGKPILTKETSQELRDLFDELESATPEEEKFDKGEKTTVNSSSRNLIPP